ncbi:Dopamine D2-like receptor [Eufriesea mexicana]|uniref:Dopamine D2-like receptor n=1 Tax=Eufriesea mexicana TaxID=516756 RepID=A0A310SDZ1_9HYME|nr:PREDICTED: uncharacterized protein LOC108553716 [Eufriesea mexicana]OAD52485.1 Dopamine D2-like receptor [Eufriesea mexicana]
MFGDSPDIAGEGSISDLGDLEGWWNNHAIVAWSLALFGCFLLNVTLLLAFLIRPSLRTISNRFVMNLTVSNLLVCTIMNPLLIMDAASTSSNSSIADPQPIASVCAMSEGVVAIVTTSSVFSVLLIAVDQYFAVVDPLRYRARVDKLKSGILIISTWLISIIFGFLAFFNPNPQSFWLSCISKNKIWSSNITSFDFLTESTVLENKTVDLNVSEVPEIVETIESIRLVDNFDLMGNDTKIFDTFIDSTVTYGFVYAIVYSIFAYFIPFVAVCWIYISIYVAAHRNSERARRSGSRPILSSASFSEEQNGPSRLQRLQTDTIEDFRKLPKISSLSSIDETSETLQPTGQLSRRRSFSSSLEMEVSSPPIEDKTCSGIVFTVGLQRVEVTQSSNDREEDGTNDNLYNDNSATITNENVNDSKDHEENLQSEEMDTSPRVLNQHEQLSNNWITGNFVNDSSDSEDEAHFECFDNLNVIEQKCPPSICDYSSNLLEESLQVSKTIGKEGKLNNEMKQTEPTETSIEITDDQKEEHLLQIDFDSEGQLSNHKDSETVLPSPSEVRLNRRLSMTVNRDILINACENGISCNKTEKDNTGNVTELSSCLLTPIVTITPAPSKNDSLHRVSSVRSTSSYINSLKDRISNGSIFRHREEARAARISALVIVMGLICWSPYVILLVMKNLPRSTDQHLPHKYDVLASSLLILAAYISPLLFGYRSKRVKRELRRFFCFRRELSYKNNRSLMAKKVLKRRHSSNLSHFEMDHKYNIFNCVYGRNRWPKEKVQFVQVPDTALAVETCRSSFSSGASTQISSTSTEEY